MSGHPLPSRQDWQDVQSQAYSPSQQPRVVAVDQHSHGDHQLRVVAVDQHSHGDHHGGLAGDALANPGSPQSNDRLAAWSGGGATATSPAHQDGPDSAQYAQWAAQTGVANAVEQKVSALSRRTAAELRRAERERGDHSRRLEALEELCRQYLGGLDDRLVHVREEAVSEAERVSQRIRGRFDRDLKAISEVLQQHVSESTVAQRHADEALKALSKRVDVDHQCLDELSNWRIQADKYLAAHADSDGNKHNELAARFEEHVDTSIGQERKHGHERLRSSCAELTTHLNELRRELMEQRHVAEQLEARALPGLRADLETQIAELGGALASRLQGKISTTNKALEEKVNEIRQEFTHSTGNFHERAATLEGSDEWLGGQVQLWRRESSELSATVQSLQELMGRTAEKASDAAREEARTVHMEVMSIDSRLASIEERLADDPDRRRYGALLRLADQKQKGAHSENRPC